MNRVEWSDHLAAIASTVLADTPLIKDATADEKLSFIGGFADELGHSRLIDRPLLSRLLSVPVEPPEMCDNAVDEAVDLAIWWALHNGKSIDGMVEPGPGPIIGEAEFSRGAIEMTTETELASLHALSHHVQDMPVGAYRDQLLNRCMHAARWHVDTLQPDNGTNHPWAIQVFIQLAEQDERYSAAAALHAEGLLHNSMVRSGRPDRFSACILLDASRTLALID